VGTVAQVRQVSFKGVSESDWRKFKSAAAAQGYSTKELFLRLIREATRNRILVPPKTNA
jgi:hypothetical protein